MADEPEWVLLARLIRPQGRRGEVLAEILTDFPDRFAERKRVFLLPGAPAGTQAARPVEVQEHWLHKGRVVLKFAGVDSISDAELLRGLDVAVPFAERAVLEDGSYYIGDLMDCTLIAASSRGDRVVGVIEAVERPETVAGVEAAATLVVRSAAGSEHLIPFAKAYLRDVDTAAKRVVMELPEGLIEGE